MRALEPYHYAWLSLHQDRSEEWLRARLKDGFHVHHLDGDHWNNDPSNLVLVEGKDHMRLHGCVVTGTRPRWRRIPKACTAEEGGLSGDFDLEIGRRGYEMRSGGASWSLIEETLLQRNVQAYVRRYAADNGLRYPVPTPATRMKEQFGSRAAARRAAQAAILDELQLLD